MSKFEVFLVRSAALCGLNEIVLLSVAIVALSFATAVVAYEVGLIG